MTAFATAAIGSSISFSINSILFAISTILAKDDLIRGRRAKRGYTNKPVPIEVVKDILSIARLAPSSSNTQPWKCAVLTGKARERIVAAAVKNFSDNHDTLALEYPFFPDPRLSPDL
ncbi:nitroreductase family protein [Bradyrhizobium sp. LLZ17]|uniref:Nitroreductase family protein n=1 Tax=Bradyrhizobium sp. LLZ17 TaxID=3239388 RepID=A0AB39XJL7_9BRAD